MITVFFDTNILIPLLNQSDIELPINARYYTSQKNIYEYKHGLKRYMMNKDFLIQCLKGNNNLIESDNILRKKAYEIVKDAFNDIPSPDMASLIIALKSYDLKYEFGISGEWLYCDDKETLLQMRKYVSDFDDHDPIFQLYYFYRHIRIRFEYYSAKIDKLVSNMKIETIIYQQIFSNDLEGYALNEYIDGAYIPAEDLEIVLACLKSRCRLFLSCDQKLIKSSRSLGLNHMTTFRLCHPLSLLQDICDAIKDKNYQTD